MQAASRLVPFQNGYCVYLTSVEANFGLQKMQVFVASELKQGGCAYNAVLDHENQHVAINRETVKEFAPRIHAQLQDELEKLRPVFTRDTGSTTAAILDRIKIQSAGLVNQFSDTMSRRHAVIDTANNYAATSKLCPDWNGTK